MSMCKQGACYFQPAIDWHAVWRGGWRRGGGGSSIARGLMEGV